jgi:UrcA family protein
MPGHLPRSITTALLLAILLPAASPLAAAETRSLQVRSSDLNLTRQADRVTLQQRIAHAVDRVCGSAHARTTADVQAYAACSQAARASAASQFDAMVAKAQADMKVAGGRKTTASTE